MRSTTIIDRLGIATGPDRVLDQDIFDKLIDSGLIAGNLRETPRYTESADDAFNLIEELLPTWAASVGQNIHYRHWVATLNRFGEDGRIVSDSFNGPTRALALMNAVAIAALPLDKE